VSPARVLLADDHTLVMEGLKALLGPHVDLVGTVANGLDLIAAAVRLQPDVVILDISMPGMNGIEAARRLLAGPSGPKLIFLTMHGEPSYVREAMRLGAHGYLLKSSAISELVEAIRTVLRGQRYIAAQLRQAASADQPETELPNPSEELSERQLEVLRLLAMGASAKEIAFALKISPKTADFHKAAIRRKLKLRTTAALTRYAVLHGFIEE